MTDCHHCHEPIGDGPVCYYSATGRRYHLLCCPWHSGRDRSLRSDK